MANYSTTFTAANGTLLTAVAGGSWTVPSGGTSMQIQNNRALAVNTFTIRMLAPTTPATTDGEVESDLLFLSTPTNLAIGVGLRMGADTTLTGYFLRYLQSANIFRVDRIVAGTTTPLGSTYAAGTIPANAVRNLRLRVVGNQVTGWVDGVQIVNVTDASPIAAAGKPGIISGGVASSTTVGANFEGFDYRDVSSNTAPTVTLDAARTDVEPWETVTHTATPADSQTLVGSTVQWTVESGGVTLTGANSTSCAYIAPATLTGTTVTLGCVVTDAEGLSSSKATVSDTILYAAERDVTTTGQKPLRIVAP